MALFEQRGGLRHIIGEHRTSNIPAELGWEQLSAGILAGVAARRKRRRAAFWWWTTGATFLLAMGILWFLPQRVELGYFPVGLPAASQIKSQTQIENSSTVTNDSSCIIPTNDEILQSNKSAITIKGVPSNFDDSNYNSVSIFNTENKLSEFANIPVAPKLTLYKNIAIDSTLLDSNLTKMEIYLLPTLTFWVENSKDELIVNNLKPTDVQRTTNWQIEIAGYSNSFESNYRTDEPNVNTPAAYETPLTGWQTGVRLRRKLGDHWRLSAGVQFQQLRYRSKFSESLAINLYRPNTIDTIFISAFTGTETYTYRDSVSGLRTRNFQHYNQHTSLQIPFLIGYEMDFKRWSVAVQSGVNFHIHQQHRGRTLTNPTKIIELDDTDFYKNTVRFSYLLETQLQYRITQRSRLFTRIGWEKHGQNWLRPAVGVTQRPSVIYIGAGMNWDIR